MTENILKVLVFLAIAGLIVFGLWAWFAGPCWIYTFSAATDIPGRCMMGGN